MKKTLTIFGFLLATSALFSQSISANFQTDMEGWTSHQSTVEWANLLAPMNDRGGISFSRESEVSFREGEFFLGERLSKGPIAKDLSFLFVQKELTELSPKTNYRITFNMNWLAWLEISASPIFVKVGAIVQQPTGTMILSSGDPVDGDTSFLYEKNTPSYWQLVSHNFNRGELGQDGRDFVVAGQLTPNENGLAFTQNINNFDNAFYVNTDDKGRLFLMIGIETENPKIENVFLNTLRIILREVPETEEVQEDDKAEEDEEKTDYDDETDN